MSILVARFPKCLPWFLHAVIFTGLLQSLSVLTEENQHKCLPFCEDDFPFLRGRNLKETCMNTIRCNFYQFMPVMFPNISKGQLLHLYLKEHSLLLPGKVLSSILYRGRHKGTEWPINNQKHFQHSHIFTLHSGALNTCPALFFSQIPV